MKRAALTALRPKLPRFPKPGFAAAESELRSFGYVAKSLTFWARQMHRVRCEACGMQGAMRIDVRTYALRFDCDHCGFEHVEVFEAKPLGPPP